VRRRPVARSGVALTLRRRPRLRNGLVVAIAVVCGVTVAMSVQAADRTRAAWGSTISVLVVTDDLAAGDRLDPSNTKVVGRPEPLVPDGALMSLPPDARAAAAMYAGEVVREERLASTGASALTARLPPGSRAMAIPVEPGTTPPVVVGDLVEVLVALGPDAAGGGPPGFALATGVPVIDVTDAAITIAVGDDVAPRLAVAFGQGAVTLAVVGD